MKSTRNGYVLDRAFSDNGYDWWWHNLYAVNRETGEERPFFIEYFVINPALGGAEPILGQLPENKAAGRKPSYAMMMAGTWGEDAVQIKNYYGIDALRASTSELDVAIGPNVATETHLMGSVSVTAEEAAAHPEYLSDAGEISWNLTVQKPLSYSVGYAGAKVFRELEAFDMFWHVEGIKSLFGGEIIFNGEVYDVIPERSWGYQDKNFGRDYTNPWIWLSVNDFTSSKTGEQLTKTSLDIGGGNPRALGIDFGEKALMAFYWEGKLFEFNFTKLWDFPKTLDWNVTQTDEVLNWQVEAKERNYKFVINFSNPKNKMLKILYENPAGEVNHDDLLNGAHAEGTIEIYRKRWIIYGIYYRWELEDTLIGRHGAGEYGAH
ncbi:tocopherol cyclase family protein [Microbulbifer aestuariivivens]|uniref:tocopherol cyclase family protein n=1 Tax=Microbulbifer aestuariivivens TaxID=1908308 RepID=UPI0031F13A19